jgi:Domain of unknown function (DUF4219)
MDQSYKMTNANTTSSSTIRSSHKNVYQIDPLTGADNYAVWKIKMMDILMGQDLWKYVDRTTMEPSDVTAKAAWKKKDRMVLSTI